MRQLFRSFVTKLLKRLAQDYLKNNNVQVVFVMGEGYKAHIKDNILATLNNSNIPARGNFKGYNFDIGIPLSILNQQAGFTSPLKWINLIKEAKNFSKNSDDTKVMVLEIEIGREGDSDIILDIVKPTVTIVDSLDQKSPVFDEYKKIVEATGKRVLLNIDQVPESLASDSKDVQTYGSKEGATIYAKNIEEHDDHQSFTLQKGDFSQNMKMNIFSVHPIYSFLVTNLVLDYFYN